MIDGRGSVSAEAVAADLLRDLGGAPAPEFPAALAGPRGLERRNRLRLALVAAWLLHDPWFVARGGLAGRAARLLAGGLEGLVRVVDAERFVTDPDRREELARRVLAALQLRPDGEGEAQAEDRLATLDSVERRAHDEDARAEATRARRVRDAMRKKAAEEAAARVTRE